MLTKARNTEKSIETKQIETAMGMSVWQTRGSNSMVEYERSGTNNNKPQQRQQ
jgi:hypothetical protein